MIKMKQSIELKTADAMIFFKISLGKNRTLFDAAMFKIALLYMLANQRNVYAFIEIMKIQSWLEEFDNLLHSKSNRIKRAIKKELGYFPKVILSTQEKKQLECSNPLNFLLIQLLLSFDEFISVLLVAKNSHIFKHQNDFFKSKKELRDDFFKVLSNIIGISTKKLPLVNFNHYLENDEVYQKALHQYGEIEPQALYNAIHSSTTPSLTAEELNRMTFKLKQKKQSEQTTERSI